MIDNAYLERVAKDLKKRIGSRVVNTQTVPIHSVTLTDCVVIVTAEPIQGLTQVTSIKLYDEQGNLLTQRITNLSVSD